MHQYCALLLIIYGDSCHFSVWADHLNLLTGQLPMEQNVSDNMGYLFK